MILHVAIGQGIGKAIALRLARDGFDVVVNDIPTNEANANAVSDEIKNTGRQSSVQLADVSVEDQVEKMVDNVVRDHGGLDVVTPSLSKQSVFIALTFSSSLLTDATHAIDGCECWTMHIRVDSR